MSATAFVHDNFVQAGGGERVAEELARCFPDADVVTTVVVPERLSPYMRTRVIKTTWLQHFPLMKRLYRHYFLLYPLAAKSIDLLKYDLIVSSCYGFAKMVRKAPGAMHVCYCHTPTRWIWRYDDYSSRESFGRATRFALKLIVGAMKRVDMAAANNVDYFIANSRVVAERIKIHYGRSSVVIYPPIRVSEFVCSQEVDDYYLVVSRLVPYKRIDLAIQACERLGRPLKIVGGGPDLERLRTLAGPHTEFLGRQSDAQVRLLMSRCRALLFPGEEDFGLTPLEASASGRPSVAYGRGGALDTVIEGLNGVHFAEPTAESLADAILRSEAIEWSSPDVRRHAEGFDTSVFQEKLTEAISRFAHDFQTTSPRRELARA